MPLVFSTWNISCHSFLAWNVANEKSATRLIDGFYYVTSCFSLAAFKILFLSWNFAILIMMCLEVCLFGFLLIGTLCVSWICVTFSFIKLGEFHHYFSKQVFYPLLLFFSFWYPCYMDIFTFHVVLQFP